MPRAHRSNVVVNVDDRRRVPRFSSTERSCRQATWPASGTDASWRGRRSGRQEPIRRGAFTAKAAEFTPASLNSAKEAAHLSAQLPLLIRGIYFERWHPAHKPTKTQQGGVFEQVGARL